MSCQNRKKRPNRTSGSRAITAETGQVGSITPSGRANVSRGGDPVEEALRAARRVAEAHIPAVVIDTERQFVSLGLAAQVAQVMGAPCYRVEELRARPLAQLVRGHSPAAG